MEGTGRSPVTYIFSAFGFVGFFGGVDVCIDGQLVGWLVGRVWAGRGRMEGASIMAFESACITPVRTSYHRLVLGARSRAVNGTCLLGVLRV